MNEESKRLSDSDIARILESSPPPPPSEEDIRDRETKRVCPLCKTGFVPLIVAEAYFTVVRLIRRRAQQPVIVDLLKDMGEDEVK